MKHFSRLFILGLLIGLVGCHHSNPKPARYDVPLPQIEDTVTEATNFVASRKAGISRPPVIPALRGVILRDAEGNHNGTPYYIRDGKKIIGSFNPNSYVITLVRGYPHATFVHECIHFVVHYNKVGDPKDPHPDWLRSDKYHFYMTQSFSTNHIDVCNF